MGKGGQMTDEIRRHCDSIARQVQFDNQSTLMNTQTNSGLTEPQSEAALSRCKATRYGRFVDERCPNCGKFASREDCFYDRIDRNNDASELLRFCTLECANHWHELQ